MLSSCADSEEEIKQRQDDSLDANSRRIAIHDFRNNEFLIRDSSLEYCADYAEEIFYLQYHLKPNIWHYYNETPCVIPPGGFPENRPTYKSTIDSLLALKCGPNIYLRIKKSADSLKELYPDRYSHPMEPVTDCWYSPTYIPNNDSLKADLRKLVKYPATAICDNVSGVVYVRVHIDSTGTIVDATIAKGVRSDLDSAAVDAAMRLGKFQSENSNGEKEAGELVIPIKFTLK